MEAIRARVAAPDIQPWNARSINQELLRSGLQGEKWLPAYAFLLDGAGEGLPVVRYRLGLLIVDSIALHVCFG
jgi:hypothetical protein